MSDDLSAAVERLRTSAQRLNAITDTASQLLRETESFLEESNVGVPAAVSLGLGAYAPDAEAPDWEDFATYRRSSAGKFRICFVRRDSDPHVEESVRAWSECSRDEKLALVAALPALLVALADKVNEKTDKAEQVIAALAPQLLAKKRKGGA